MALTASQALQRTRSEFVVPRPSELHPGQPRSVESGRGGASRWRTGPEERDGRVASWMAAIGEFTEEQRPLWIVMGVSATVAILVALLLIRL